MGVDMKVKAIYDSEIGNITRSEKNWKDVLKVAGQLYRYEFDNIVMVTAQRPPEKSTLMADYDTWKKVGRHPRGAAAAGKRADRGYGQRLPHPGSSRHPLPDCHRPGGGPCGSASGTEDHKI